MQSLAFQNGRWIPANELALSFADAGFVLAATVTDFCRTYRHRLFRWPDHLARLRHDCDTLRIPLPYSDAELTATAEELVAHNAKSLPESDDLALVTFATPGPLGYLLGMSDNGPPTIGMHTFPLPKARYRRFFTEGVTLAMAGNLPVSDIPADVKHRSRLNWWFADQMLRDPAHPCHTPGAIATLTDAHGNLDTAIGNVLVVIDDVVIRPPRGTVLEGVSLTVMAELCERLELRFAEGIPDVDRATELLIVGSGFGVAGVRRFVSPARSREFPWPGPVFRQLLTAWSNVVKVDLAKQFE